MTARVTLGLLARLSLGAAGLLGAITGAPPAAAAPRLGEAAREPDGLADGERARALDRFAAKLRRDWNALPPAFPLASELTYHLSMASALARFALRLLP